MRGRGKRWNEQVRHVVEEMRCVAVSHAKTTERWVQRTEEVMTWTADGPMPSWANDIAPRESSIQAIGASGAVASAIQASPSQAKPVLAPDIVRGLRAYAYRQSNTWQMLGISCVRLWAPFLQKHKKDVVWPESMRAEAAAAVKRALEQERLKAEKAGKLTVTVIDKASSTSSSGTFGLTCTNACSDS